MTTFRPKPFLRQTIPLLLAFFLFWQTPLHAQKNTAPEDLHKLLEPSATTRLGVAVDDKLLKDFYQKRGYDPAWQLDPPHASTTIKDFIAFVRDTLAEHGLSAKNYPFKALQKKADSGDKDELLQADVLASDCVLHLARSLAGQDPVPQSHDHTWPLKHAKIDLVSGLNHAINTHNVSDYLEGLLPPLDAYAKLKAALLRYREIYAKGGWLRLRPGTIIESGMEDVRIPKIYQRLAQEGYLEFDSKHFAGTLYDDALVEAMKQFQETHGLYADGNIGPETFRALNVPVQERIDQIRVNMARLRQSPPDAWSDIVINIPSARLSYYRDGTSVYEAPVVVGRVDRPSPLVASAIDEIIINPSWYVPRSIAEKDLLPKAEEDPNYLRKLGIKRRGGSDGGEEMFRQDPGPLNSLGRIKFNFPNRFSVYMHGTPHVELFDKDDRTRSSGCIRLKEPVELAEILMKHNPDWSAEKIQKKIDSLKTTRTTPPEKTPIKLLYWTTLVDNKDRVQFFLDVYGLDEEWLKLL